MPELKMYWDFTTSKLAYLNDSISKFFIKSMHRRSVQLFETDIFCLVNFFDIRFKEILLGSELSQIEILIGIVNCMILYIEGYTRGEKLRTSLVLMWKARLKMRWVLVLRNMFQQFQRIENR